MYRVCGTTMNKAERLEKLLPNGRGVWIPIDHGMSDYATHGLEDTERLIRDVVTSNLKRYSGCLCYTICLVVFVDSKIGPAGIDHSKNR